MFLAKNFDILIVKKIAITEEKIIVRKIIKIILGVNWANWEIAFAAPVLGLLIR